VLVVLPHREIVVQVEVENLVLQAQAYVMLQQQVVEMDTD
jgi:hypothetical protein